MASTFELIKIADDDTDKLTGILRRDSLEAKVGKSISQRSRESGQYSVILFDIDYFKAINDILSHAQGDKVLTGIGKILKAMETEMSQYAGIYGRWGGEEFLVALPYATEDDATTLAEKIRTTVQDYAFQDVKTRGRLEEQITVTLGVNCEDVCALVQSSKEGNSGAVARRVVGKADKALSYGKLLGKNQVAVFSRYLEKELENLHVVRRFYFAVAKTDIQKAVSALSRSRNLRSHSDLKNKITRHIEVMDDAVDSKDKRTQSVFADNTYRKIRELPCTEKVKVLNFMNYFIQGRYG